MISSSRLIAVHVLFLYMCYSVPQLCLQELTYGSWALFENILKPLKIFTLSGLWRKPCFPEETTPVWCPSWDVGPESSLPDSGKSEWSGSLLPKSMQNHVESGETDTENKSLFRVLIVFASEAACKNEVINFCNTGTTADGSRKR